MTDSIDGIARLTHLGVIRAQGEDAAKFLHNQLTQDFALLGLQEARLAAFCSAKGRMQASFIGFKRSPDDILLVCSRDLLAPTLKRLSMFVLRAKAKLSDASDEFAVWGLLGSAMAPHAAAVPSTWAKTEVGNATLVALPSADGRARGLWVAPAEGPAPAGVELPLAVWQWAEVRSGVVLVSAAVVEAFVPQMLNYESVGGVNFKKGCYPGQEVVARSQFRGTLKRRAFLAHTQEQLQAGQEVFHSSDAAQPCGLVVQAAPSPQGGWAAVISIQISAASDGTLTVNAAGGPSLSLDPLPYALMLDI